MTIVLPEWILWAAACYLAVKAVLDIAAIALRKQEQDRAWRLSQEK